MGIVAAALLAVLAPGAHAGDRRTDEVRPEIIYHNYCSVCHGDRGDGNSRARGSLNPPPADFTAPGARSALTRERMILALQYGRPNTAMTPWTTQLSEKEIESVVDYIRETMMAPEPGSPRAKGRALYASHCVACHGERGQGVAASPSHPAPRAFSADAARAEMVSSVAQGRFGSLKHAFADRMKPEEIESTVDYVRLSLVPPLAAQISGTRAHGGRGRDGAPSDATAPLPEGLNGNPGRGRALYAQNCVACHGEKGDGKGPRALRLGTKTGDFGAASYNRPALYAAIAGGRAGSEMPAWRGVLDRQQIADLTEYTWRTWFQKQSASR